MKFDFHLFSNVLAASWFLICWIGYSRYASRRAKGRHCLSNVLHRARQTWMQRLLLRENRIADASAIGNLERNASFFASSTLLILAGILTVLGSSEMAVSVLADLPFIQPASRELSELKLLSLAIVFVYAFFTFSWCMRQYNFASVLIGAASMPSELHITEKERAAFVERTARVISLAANEFNLGLRSYYFALSLLAWFINPWLFMLISTGVMWVLYRREFHSRVLNVMLDKSPLTSGLNKEIK